MKKGDKLYCHNNDLDFLNILTVGDYYTIVDISNTICNKIGNKISTDRSVLYIYADNYELYNFTSIADKNGLSYKTWFYDIIEQRRLKIKQLELHR